MTTTLGELLDTLTDAAHDATRSATDAPVRADAGCALGHLGRALTQLHRDGVSPLHRGQREQRVTALAAACTELAARAPATEARLTRLAASAADTLAVLHEHTTLAERWASAVAVADTVTALSAVLTQGTGAVPAADWLSDVQRQAVLVQLSAATQPPTRTAATILDRPVAATLTSRHSDADLVRTATAVLVAATSKPSQRRSLAEVLAYTLAAETLASAAEALRHAGTEATPAQATAADGWRAVRAALRPFNDGSRHRHDVAPPAVDAARRLQAALRHAGSRPSTWSTPLRVAVAAASQHLPTLATQLHRTACSWADTGALFAYARDLPFRPQRVAEHLAGYRPGGLIRADTADLRPALNALGHVHLLSVALASAAVETSPHPGRAFPRRTWAANRALVDRPESAAALAAATHNTYLHLQATNAAPPRPRPSR
ncbi:MAG TPA: hypothetical protein VGL39_24915 [Jatrophihabitantaceae bacterium]|jgi:hypothetical protein